CEEDDIRHADQVHKQTKAPLLRSKLEGSAVMPPDSRHDWPENHRKHDNDERTYEQRQLECAIFVPRRFLKHHEGKIDDAHQVARVVALKPHEVLIVHVAEHHGSNLAQLFGFAVWILEIAHADGSIVVSRNLGLPCHVKHFHDGGI